MLRKAVVVEVVTFVSQCGDDVFSDDELCSTLEETPSLACSPSSITQCAPSRPIEIVPTPSPSHTYITYVPTTSTPV